MNGVSVVICCHNSADKLPLTIKHVNNIVVSSEVLWEVIIVDNASTDGTSDAAVNLLSAELKSITRIVVENELGLRNARIRGIVESKYDYISFIDDDNWICPQWVQICYEVLSNDRSIGACGGKSEAEYDNCTPPEWFDEFKDNFAVGSQGDAAGYVPDSRGYLWGAGLTIRREAWIQLYSKGFSFALTGRKGKSLSSGEDAELCFALRLAGWRLYYEPRLAFKHVITPDRLEWSYLRKLKRSFGRTAVIHKAYADTYNGVSVLNVRDLFKELSRVVNHMITSKAYKHIYDKTEGSNSSLSFEYMIGYIIELIKSLIYYGQTQKQFEIIKRITDINTKYA